MTDTAREKRHAKVAKLAWESKEPAINPMDYSSSLTRLLNFHNFEVDNNLKKEWAIAYWKGRGLSVKGFDRIHETNFQQVGVLVRVLSKGYSIDEAHLEFIEAKRLEFLAKLDNTTEKPESNAVKLTKADKDDILYKEIATQVDAGLDEIAMTDKKTINLKSLVVGKYVDSSVGKLLIDHYSSQMDEFQSALLAKDEQLKEAYSHLSKKTIRVMYDFLSELVGLCNQAKTVSRKPRAIKAKPPSKIVEKVQYLKEYPELKLKSVHPEKIVGASVVYLFNIKYRKLYKMIAAENLTISVKGTTMINWDTALSGGKTIRKPEEMFSDLSSMTKRPFGKKFDDVRSVLAKATGRIGSDTLILAVF